MALPKQYRLTRKKEFEQVYDSGKTVRNSFLFIKFFKDSSLEGSKFGIVVSAKVSKKATVRNKIRRQISEAIKPHLKQVSKNVNVVIVTNSKIVDKTFTEIEKVVLDLLKKGKILS